MDKYLRQYAEPGTAAIAGISGSEPWGRVIVVPVCNELTGILRPLPCAEGRSLVILVVNETETAPRHVSLANQAFAAEVRSRFDLCWQSDFTAGLSLYRDQATPRDVLLVDRFSKGLRFSAKGGVGHARKAGADLAAFLIHKGQVRSPWIHCSDGDVRLPPRYFSASAAIGEAAAEDISALVYPFIHTLDECEALDDVRSALEQKILDVTRLYEFSLHYYVAGLKFAGSPYAFHTIGSTIAINAAHYAKVRGFPRRQAGEDFYLLNKLAKVGSIRQLDFDSECEPIEIRARLSDRVPFGTGAATGKILELECPQTEFLVYHPAVFDQLRDWLDSLPAFWNARTSSPREVFSQAQQQALADGLEKIGAGEALQHALRQSADFEQFNKQMHTWFDAFRTLKLIHFLRDHHFPSISYQALLTEHEIEHLLPADGRSAYFH